MCNYIHTPYYYFNIISYFEFSLRIKRTGIRVGWFLYFIVAIFELRTETVVADAVWTPATEHALHGYLGLCIFRVVAFVVLGVSVALGYRGEKLPLVRSTAEMEALLVSDVPGVEEAKILSDGKKIRKAGLKVDRGLIVYVAPVSGDAAADKATADLCKHVLGVASTVRVTVQVQEELPTQADLDRSHHIEIGGRTSPEGDADEDAITPTKPIDPNRGWLYIGGCCIFFLRYVVATFLSPFFADICQPEKLNISLLMQGIIFSCFPIGIATTSAIAPGLIMKIGTRKAVAIGMAGTTIFTVLFGLVPDMTRMPTTPRWMGWYSNAPRNSSSEFPSVNADYANLIVHERPYFSDEGPGGVGLPIMWSLPTMHHNTNISMYGDGNDYYFNSNTYDAGSNNPNSNPNHNHNHLNYNYHVEHDMGVHQVVSADVDAIVAAAGRDAIKRDSEDDFGPPLLTSLSGHHSSPGDLSQYAIFAEYSPASQKPPSLMPDWEHRVQAVANLTLKHADTVTGIRISSGLVSQGLPLENLTAVSVALRNALLAGGAAADPWGVTDGGIFLYASEIVQPPTSCNANADCPPSGFGKQKCNVSLVAKANGTCVPIPLSDKSMVPSGLDYVSLDYSPDYLFAAHEEVSIMKAVYEAMLIPGLNATTQRMFVTPRISGESAQAKNASYMHQLDLDSLAKYNDYWEWVTKDPQLDGILSHHWANQHDHHQGGGGNDNNNGIGAQSLPELLAATEAYVDQAKEHNARAVSNQKLAMYLFMLIYFLNGLVGAFAETGTTIMLTQKFEDKLGAVTASIGTVCGLGCLAGPTIGGILYDIPKRFDQNADAIWGNQLCFRLPFYTVGFLCLVVTIFVFFRFGNVQAQAGDVTAPISSVLSFKRLISLIAIALNGTIVATLDPTLSNKLFAQPFGYSADKVGLLFTVSSVLYIIASVPVGWMMDRTNSHGAQYASKVCKLTQSSAFFFLMVCFMMLGPFKIGKLDFNKAFNNVPSVWVAMMFKGMGSAGNNAGYPDIAIGIPSGDNMKNATLAGLWNAAYALGWAAGPLLGGALYGAQGFSAFSTATAVTAFVYGVVMLIAGFVVVETGDIDSDGGDSGEPKEVRLRTTSELEREERRPLLLLDTSTATSTSINA